MSLQKNYTQKNVIREEIREKIRDKKAKRHTENKIARVTSPLLVITLNVNGLNSLNRRQRLAKWIKEK